MFQPGATLKFPTVVGLAHGLQFTLPGEAGQVRVTARVDAGAVGKKTRFTVASLMIKAAAAAAVPAAPW